MTLAPGVYGFDSAELATGVFTQGIIHPPGYPLYLLVGKLFTLLPFGDVAYRLNLMSAVFASLTVVALFGAIGNIIENFFAAWFSALLFAFSNYFWQMALIAEVYTTLTAFLAFDLFIISLWRRTGLVKYLLSFSILYGLTLSVHTSGILFAPAFAWLVLTTKHWKKLTWQMVGCMTVLFIAGLLPFAYLSVRASAAPLIDYSRIYSGVDLTTPSGLWWMISGRAYRIFAFGYAGYEIPNETWRFAGFLWRNYLGVGVILGGAGILWLLRRKFTWTVGLLLAFLACAIFYINYRVMDKDTMFLPAYEVWAIFVGAGFVAGRNFIEWMINSALLRPWTKRMASSLPALFVILGLVLNWRWVDMSRANGYTLFATGMISGAAPDSIIIAPWSSAVVLEYYQVVEGQRPDLRIINRSRHAVARYYELWTQGLSRPEILEKIYSEEVDLIDWYIHRKTVYAVEYDPVLANKFEYIPDGPIFRLDQP